MQRGISNEWIPEIKIVVRIAVPYQEKNSLVYYFQRILREKMLKCLLESANVIDIQKINQAFCNTAQWTLDKFDILLHFQLGAINRLSHTLCAFFFSFSESLPLILVLQQSLSNLNLLQLFFIRFITFWFIFTLMWSPLFKEPHYTLMTFREAILNPTRRSKVVIRWINSLAEIGLYTRRSSDSRCSVATSTIVKRLLNMWVHMQEEVSKSPSNTLYCNNTNRLLQNLLWQNRKK